MHNFTPLSALIGGLLIGLINVGMILSYFLIRYADVWGRRRVMALTIFGYTLTSILTGLAPNVFLFCAAQLLARMFQMTELAVAMVYAAEEFPAERRGRTIALIQACFSVGAIGCAAVTPRLLQTGSGWRAVYLFGASSIGLLLFAARGLRETGRFLRTTQSELAALAGLSRQTVNEVVAALARQGRLRPGYGGLWLAP